VRVTRPSGLERHRLLMMGLRLDEAVPSARVSPRRWRRAGTGLDRARLAVVEGGFIVLDDAGFACYGRRPSTSQTSARRPAAIGTERRTRRVSAQGKSGTTGGDPNRHFRLALGPWPRSSSIPRGCGRRTSSPTPPGNSQHRDQRPRFYSLQRSELFAAWQQRPEDFVVAGKRRASSPI